MKKLKLGYLAKHKDELEDSPMKKLKLLLVFQRFEGICGMSLPLSGGFFVPIDRLFQIFGHSFTLEVAHAEIVLSIGMSLLGSFLQPRNGLRKILFYAFSGVVT